LKDGEVKIELPFQTKYEYWLKPFIRWSNYDINSVLLSGFISDGLRTLLTTLDVPNIREITLRTTDHFIFIRSLIENGFFKEEHLENTSKVLVDKWKMTEEDRDYSILEVSSKGAGKRINHFMFDQYDEMTEIHSMARVTGLPAVAMVEAILEGKYTQKGVIPPEYVAQNDEIYDFVVEYLQNYGIAIIEEN
jgi:saccharopine dehydrogenase-like NADP-dependent oxidoreductase